MVMAQGWYENQQPLIFDNSNIYDNSVDSFYHNQTKTSDFGPYQNYGNQITYQQAPPNVFDPTMQQLAIPTYPPCQGPQPWNYAYCYGYFGEEPCQYIDVVDMEDFMNNEKRKEKSRDAARCRRSRETEIFSELALALPMKQEDVDHLDKASVMRLSIAFLKVRGMLDLFPHFLKKGNRLVRKTENSDEKEEDDDDYEEKFSVDTLTIDNEKAALQALDGFLLVLSTDGDVTYVSENVNEYMGISQIDLMGNPIWEYSHQCDHDELREALNGRRQSPSEVLKGTAAADFQPQAHRDFMLRLKCTLTSRGRSVNIKSASYKVIHVTGHIAFKEDGQRELVAIARPLPHPSNIEVPLGSSTFLTKHSLDMKFSYVDDKMYNLLGYEPGDLLGQSLYECHHGSDSDSLMQTFKNLISKGQSETCRYRFLAKMGGFSWIVTQATILYDKQKPQSVVCVNYVISGVENKDEIYSSAQLAERKLVQPEPEPAKPLPIVKEQPISDTKVIKEKTEDYKENIAKKSDIIIKVKKSANIVNRPVSVTASIFTSRTSTPIKLPPEQSSPKQQPKIIAVQLQKPPQPQLLPKPEPSKEENKLPPGPLVTATSKIFAKRTEDMNKGFLMFSEDEPGLTMLKDEPDDLTHLAPTPGDACIPLEESGPFFNDMFDDFIIPETYTSILHDDLNSLDSQGSSHKSGNTTASNNNDPFINYRDEISDISNSPHLLSPGMSKSPEGSSLPSLCSPNGSLPEDELAFMTLNMEDELDLSMRAPYISMCENDDLPLLTSDDLMWSATSVGSCLTGNGSGLSNSNSQNKFVIKNEFGQTTSNTQTTTNTNNMSNQEQKQQQQQNNENNVNINSKPVDSSLAALLCGNVINLQSQSQPSHTTNNTNNNNNNNQIHVQHPHLPHSEPEISENKKYKLANDQGLLHPMVVISPTYNKNCNTWTMNDLLQLNNSNLTSNSKIHTVITSIVTKKNQLNNKRAASDVCTNAKRLKCSPSSTDRQTSSSPGTPPPNFTLSPPCPQISSSKSSPQLLQQLMAPSPVPQKTKPQTSKFEPSRWADGQTSNSVLMNLLVSGCDKNVTLVPPEILMDHGDSSTSSKMHDHNSRHTIDDDDIPYFSNPLIGGLAAGNSQSPKSPQPQKNEFVCHVSPSLLTPTDMEIWRAIQSGIDPKKVIPHSMRTAPAPAANQKELLLVMDPSHVIDISEHDYEMNIPTNEIMQNNL